MARYHIPVTGPMGPPGPPGPAGTGGTGGAAATAISGIAASNTTYTSGTVTLTGSNIVTVRTTTGQQVIIDATTAGFTQSTQTGSVHAISNSQASRSGTVNLSGAGAVNVGTQTGNAFTISAPVQTAETAISGISASDTVYTSGTVKFTGSNMVTVKTTTGQQVIIDATQVPQTTQTGSVHAISNSQASRSGTVNLSGAGAVNVGTETGNAFTISAPNQSLQTSNVHNVTLSGNTAGVMAHISSGTMTLAGGPNITVSQAGNAVSISGAAGAGGAETQTAISGIAASNTTYTSGSVTFTGVGGGITVSSNTGQRVDLSVAAPVAQTAETGSFIPAGNTTGTTASLPFNANIQVAGGNNITISQSSGTNSSRVTISGPVTIPQTAVTMSSTVLPTIDQNAASGASNINGATAYYQPFYLPDQMNVQRVAFQQSAFASTSGGTASFRVDVGLYSKDPAGSSISSIATSSFTTSWSSGTNSSTNWGGFSGNRRFNVPFAVGDVTPGHYFMGFQAVSNGNSYVPVAVGPLFPRVLAASDTAGSRSGYPFGLGQATKVISNNVTIAASDITNNTAGQQWLPWLMVYNTGLPW